MKEFEKYSRSIVKRTGLGKKDKKETMDEIILHLNLLKKENLENGCSVEESIKLAMQSFGNSNELKHNFQKIVFPYNKIAYSLFGIAFIVYILLLTRELFFSGFILSNREFNLIPLKSVLHNIAMHGRISFKPWFLNIFGNIVAFIPLGFSICFILNEKRSVIKVILITFAIALVCEIIQYLTGTGLADIDDVILDCLGGTLGIVAIYNPIIKLKLFLNRTLLNKEI